LHDAQFRHLYPQAAEKYRECSDYQQLLLRLVKAMTWGFESFLEKTLPVVNDMFYGKETILNNPTLTAVLSLVAKTKGGNKSAVRFENELRAIHPLPMVTFFWTTIVRRLIQRKRGVSKQAKLKEFENFENGIKGPCSYEDCERFDLPITWLREKPEQIVRHIQRFYYINMSDS
jgi:hypothetical protein